MINLQENMYKKSMNLQMFFKKSHNKREWMWVTFAHLHSYSNSKIMSQA
jgi:hypothetical protein